MATMGLSNFGYFWCEAEVTEELSTAWCTVTTFLVVVHHWVCDLALHFVENMVGSVENCKHIPGIFLMM